MTAEEFVEAVKLEKDASLELYFQRIMKHLLGV